MILEEKYILEYIKSMLMEYKDKPVVITDRYHHNSDYDKTKSILKNGILTISDLNNKGITNYSKESLNIMSDISSHINGIDAVSLAVMGLQDLYPNEIEYNPFSSKKVDIIVSDNIIASRSTGHYGNEYLSYQSIKPEMFRSIDIRLLKYTELILKNYNRESVEQLINYYNCLREIALVLKVSKLDIPLREMSENNNQTLNIDRISQSEQLGMKK